MTEAKRGCEPGCSSQHVDDGDLPRDSFMLYNTPSKFYLVGRDEGRLFWRVLTINRLVPSELHVREEKFSCSASCCLDALNRIDVQSGNLKSGILCYGIVGVVKFNGPYYLVLITERRQIGCICGHAIYAISKSEMIPFSHSTWRSNLCDAMNENRCRKLFCTVDITKNFFFSYSYGVMHSLQRNMRDDMRGQISYQSLFVWNEFLTRAIRNQLKNTLWTIALVHGFFEQVTLSTLGKNFDLVLLARRSRHFAGTRFQKRGVNKKGRVANDVETEQIVFDKDFPRECVAGITSVVQHRGSIPLFWSQEASLLKFRPDITLKVDPTFKATRVHFENLVKRYGNPIIILNLIKTHEKKPRESVLRAEFIKAIDFINKALPEDNRLKFLHWDISTHSKRRGNDVLTLLDKVAANAFSLTGFFYTQVTPDLRITNAVRCSLLENHRSNAEGDTTLLENGVEEGNHEPHITCWANPVKFQTGVLRTNCIDCLDRTNVAQYAYGLVALGHQLHALGLIDRERIDLNDPLINDLMKVYEEMGDTLARQYCGSAAHNKIFSEKRGQWEATTKSQQILRTCTRYIHNGYLDYEKQNAINLFLGNIQPHQDTAPFLELDSFKRGEDLSFQTPRLILRRSMSDGGISSELVSDVEFGDSAFFDTTTQEKLSSSPEIPVFETDSLSRTICRQFKYGSHEVCCSNFLKFDLLSSSESSCEADLHDRFSHIGYSSGSQSSEYVTENESPRPSTPVRANGHSGIDGENLTPTAPQDDGTSEFSELFADWVEHGGTFFH